MLNTILLTIYCLLFTFITWRKFHHGLFLFFLLLPTYLIRFNIGPVPTTLLEIMFGIIFVIWIISSIKNKLITSYWLLVTTYFKQHRLFFTGIFLFLLGATISIFTAVDIRSALGEWKAFYIEPVLMFALLITTINEQLSTIKKNNQLKTPNHQSPITTNLILALVLCGLATSILAIIQHFTGWHVPYAFWENRNTFRVTGWYGFPNGVGLFLAPLVPLALYLLIIKFKESTKSNWKMVISNLVNKKNNHQSPITNHILLVTCILFLITTPLAIFYAKSTGGLIGVAAGIGILLLIYKKTRWITLAIGIVGLVSLVSIPSFASLKDEVFFKDRSGQIRLSIYHETIELLKDHPLAGAGLASYDEKIKPYHQTVNGEGIEIFHHPHNIFLTMWVNTGILGLAGFTIILISFFSRIVCHVTRNTYHISRNNEAIKQYNNIAIFLIATMTTIVITGLVDSPYIKNDFALFFWLIIALSFISTDKKTYIRDL